MIVVRGVRLFSGLDSWGLREITDLCGLTLGGGVEQDLSRSETGSTGEKPGRDRSHLRLVSHG